MKRLAAVLLLSGCAMVQPVEPPRNWDEAFAYSYSSYMVGLEQMVAYRDECFSRPPELIEECKPTVDRMRALAIDARKYKDVLLVAYGARDEKGFDGAVGGLKIMQDTLKAELIRDAARQQKAGVE